MKSGLNLPGYSLGSVLWRADGRVVYRARCLATDQPVAVETLDTEYPARHQVASIRREGALGQQLADVAGVRKIHAVLPHGSGNLALVGELFDNTLKTLLVREGAWGLPVAKVLNIALGIVRALEGIHGQEVVHKALMPGIYCSTPSPPLSRSPVLGSLLN